jgi:hypothetical protein
MLPKVKKLRHENGRDGILAIDLGRRNLGMRWRRCGHTELNARM